MPQIDRHDKSLRHGIARPRLHAKIADRSPPPSGVRVGKLERSLDDRAGCPPRIPAHLHGRRPRVTRDALKRHVEPGRTLNAGDHADRRLRILENWTLLNMRLEGRVQRPSLRQPGTSIADSLELVDQPATVAVRAL